MPGQLLNTVTVIVLVASAAACTRLPQEGSPGMPGSVPAEVLDDAAVTTIPAEWGTLVGADNDPLSRNHTLLWFEDEEGTIRFIAYNHVSSRFQTTAAVIRRH